MLRITVELVPFGKEKDKSEIAKIEIANTGTKYSTDETEYKYKGYVNDWGCIRNFSGKVIHWRPNTVLLLIYKILHREIQAYIN